MFGAPVLADRTGSFPEFIQDGFNGKFASARDYKGIASALENIRENIDQYEINCRHTFLETFFYRSNLEALSKLL
jgi:glycosyltransferase involved in cell wall biosynthesis